MYEGAGSFCSLRSRDCSSLSDFILGEKSLASLCFCRELGRLARTEAATWSAMLQGRASPTLSTQLSVTLQEMMDRSMLCWQRDNKDTGCFLGDILSLPVRLTTT